ncbi:MAG TPA: carbon-nitrogen hydrolase family protein [Polyangiaceae bacterium]|nr:carbon-nitrogen hydrolase family protein [Polyangiaceae bacterium]
MKLTALEIPARFDRVADNLELTDALLARGPTDLALLPEASLTGYVSAQGDFDLTRFAEPRDGATARALAALAKKHNTHLVGPLVERLDNCVYNTMIGFDPTGAEFLHYRKRHPWYPETWATAGDAPHPKIRIRTLVISLAICFDVHFAEWPRADVLLFPSAWVEEEDSRGAMLAKLGMNVVNANWGAGEPRVPGQGDSMIVDASGKILARADAKTGPRIDAEISAAP